MDLKERNRRIAEAGSATRLRRKSQECKTFKFKVCCGNTEDRDIHAANNMIYFYLNGGKFKINNT